MAEQKHQPPSPGSAGADQLAEEAGKGLIVLAVIGGVVLAIIAGMIKAVGWLARLVRGPRP